MSIHQSYTEARANFATLWDRVADDRETVIISRRGAPDVALIAADELASLQETAHLLRSPENGRRLLTALHRALKRQGTPQDVDKLRQEVGLDSSSRVRVRKRGRV